MKTKQILVTLSKIQQRITEIMPHSGGDWEKWLGRERLFADELERRMDERDDWRVPAQNWLKLVEIGQELDRWNKTKMIYEQKAAESQKQLSRISRQWQEMTDLARGRAPAKGGVGVTTTIVAEWNGLTGTLRTAA